MIPVPHHYAAWADVIALFKSRTNDDEVLAAMQQGELEWQSGVAERFFKRLMDAANHRMNGAMERFQAEMGRTLGNEMSIVRAILGLRQEMQFLSTALDLPVLPPEQRTQIQEMIRDQVNHMQKSLEESAKKDRSGKLSSIVRNNRLDAYRGV